ncbi:tyrosine-type recombinase/integrase [Actinomyces wuliandei]|uniref:tyrosine-type recombinase/integrase n=1 Tax=Actinomyces wuliandei TaxID=2057743 RepID=UPI0011187581|nr:tyrosine-type recombinase/integrase [Actinomyces wuliandei]
MISDHLALLPVPQTWSTATRTFEVSLRAAGRRETTVSTRTRHVRQMARALSTTPPAEVTADQLLAWVATRQWAPETRHSYYVSIRAFYTTLLGSPGPAQALPAVTRPVPPPHPTPEQVYRTALARADERTRAVLYLAGSAGLRRSEIVQARQTDLITDPDAGTSLLVHAKGGRGRLIPLTEELTALIRNRSRTNPDGWVFPSRAGGHISPRWASKLASRILPPGWTLHSLRHRFATTAYAADRDILAVQRLLGHTSVSTTQRYTAPPTNAMRKAVETAA